MDRGFKLLGERHDHPRPRSPRKCRRRPQRGAGLGRRQAAPRMPRSALDPSASLKISLDEGDVAASSRRRGDQRPAVPPLPHDGVQALAADFASVSAIWRLYLTMSPTRRRCHARPQPKRPTRSERSLSARLDLDVSPPDKESAAASTRSGSILRSREEKPRPPGRRVR